MTGIGDYGQFWKDWEKRTVTKKATDWIFCVWMRTGGREGTEVYSLKLLSLRYLDIPAESSQS